MSDYFTRIELPPVDRTAPRAISSAQAVQPIAAGRSAPSPDRDARASMPQIDVASVDEDVASAAEYVEIHARIADILADLDSGTSVDGAARSIDAMLARPIILVPLPPASKEAIEHAAVVARRMVDRAAYSHAAQAHVSRGVVDQIVASAN